MGTIPTNTLSVKECKEGSDGPYKSNCRDINRRKIPDVAAGNQGYKEKHTMQSLNAGVKSCLTAV